MVLVYKQPALYIVQCWCSYMVTSDTLSSGPSKTWSLNYKNKSLNLIIFPFNFRKHIREVLKSQMTDRDANYRRCLTERMEESDRAIGYDKRCLQDDQTAFQKKSTYLRQFRDENKKVRMIWVCSHQMGNTLCRR